MLIATVNQILKSVLFCKLVLITCTNFRYHVPLSEFIVDKFALVIGMYAWSIVCCCEKGGFFLLVKPGIVPKLIVLYVSLIYYSVIITVVPLAVLFLVL